MHSPLRSVLGRTAALCGPIVLLAACGPVPQANPATATAGDPALQIHHAALTIDTHIDIRSDFNAPGNDAGRETVDQIDLPKLERGDLDVATLALFAESHKRSAENLAAARAEVEGKLAAIHAFVAAHQDRLELARTSDDLMRIAGAGKHAILLSFLNAFWLRDDLSDLPALYRDGVRVFGFAHIGNNPFAYSSRPSIALGDDPSEQGGLTPLGERAVDELNRLGVVIDVSQLTPAGVFQILARSRAPVIASHSAVKGRVNAPRNLGDDELQGIAAKGGVVHIVAFAAWLRKSDEATAGYQREVLAPFGLTAADDPQSKLEAPAYQRYLEAYTAYSRHAWRNASLADYVDAIDYAIRLIGIDHVGLSSDFNHGGGVTGFAHVGEAPNVTRELLRRGYTEPQIRKLWGENFLRVLREVEQVAHTR
jgi:microsomal dipeptidase-like Zn-dependent dipeptidase